MLPPPAGDPKMRPVGPPSHHLVQVQSGYTGQIEISTSSKTPSRVRFSQTPSESTVTSGSWSKVDFVDSPMKDEQKQHKSEIEVEQIEKLEQETGQTGENAFTMMLTHIYTNMWQGSKEATIKAIVAEAKVEEITAILKFA
eukprot:11385118-Karenia_brevis.AAC.1